jgi:hypothetical protein
MMKFPVEPGGFADCHLEGPAEEAALDQLFDRLDRSTEVVKYILEPEPGVNPEDPAISLDGLDESLAFADRAGHRFFTPDVFARFRGRDRDQGVPVGRRDDMDDVDVIPLENFPEIPVSGDTWARDFEGGPKMPFIDVADGEQPGTGISEMPPAHAADSDNRLGEFIARRSKALASQHVPREDSETGRSGGSGRDASLEEFPPGDGFIKHGLFQFCLLYPRNRKQRQGFFKHSPEIEPFVPKIRLYN